MSADPRLAAIAESLMNELENICDHEPHAQLGSTATERIALKHLEVAMNLGLAAGVEQERERCLAIVEELAGYTAPANLIAAIRAAASEAPPHP